MIGQLTTLLLLDTYPLNVQSVHRLQDAHAFDTAMCDIEVLEDLNLPEEQPPYYFKYKRQYLEKSAALNQYALNDFMALG